MKRPAIRHQNRWAAAALLAAAVLGVWSTGTAHVDPKPIAADAGPEGQDVADAALNDRLVEKMALQGIRIAPASDVSSVTPETAAAVAHGDFGFVGTATPTMTLLRLTDAPRFMNTEAWAVVYREIDMPTIGGPIGMDLPATTRVDFVVFVNARTGRYLMAIAMGLGGSTGRHA